MTACIRALFHTAQDIKNLFWPSQLTAVVRGRDYDHAVKKAADALAEAEAEVDSLEPHNGLGSVKPCACGRMLNFWASRDYEHEAWLHADDNTAMCEPVKPTIESLFDAYWNAKTPEVETQALNDIDRYYPEWGAYSRPIPDSAVPGPADPSPAPEGDDAPMADSDIPPSPAMGATKLAEIIAAVLRDHQPYQYHDSGYYWCLGSNGFNHATRGDWTVGDWIAHVAPLIAERIEKATLTTPVESGVDIGMSYAAEMFPQHRK